MVFDFLRVYHSGVRVPDVHAAMAELGPQLGVTWAEPVSTPGQSVWTPEHGQQHVPLSFTYSCEGPQHIELLEGAPGSVWDGRERPGLHHLGVWSDDVAAETEAFLAAGWTLALAMCSPDEGYGRFTYVQPPGSGLLVELVSSAARPRFENWWAGGSLR